MNANKNMKRRELMKSLAMTALGSGLVAMFGASTAEAGNFPESLDGLAVGQSYQYDKGLKLTFVKVRRDNRCPIGTKCDRRGQAVVVLRADLSNPPLNQPVRTYELRTTRNGNRISIPSWPPGMVGFKTYSVRLISLTPRPQKGKKPKQSDYRLSLDIQTLY
jgi:hypothetical protein